MGFTLSSNIDFERPDGVSEVDGRGRRRDCWGLRRDLLGMSLDLCRLSGAS